MSVAPDTRITTVVHVRVIYCLVGQYLILEIGYIIDRSVIIKNIDIGILVDNHKSIYKT